MVDIKTRKVDRSSIKTLDKSISASHRIRDAGAEIRHLGRQEVGVTEQSVSEYSTARFEEGIHRTAMKIEQAAEWGINKGVKITRKKMRDHGIKGREDRAIKSRQNMQIRKAAMQKRKNARESMRNVTQNSYKAAKTGAAFAKRISVSIGRSAKALFFSAKSLLAGISVGGIVAVVVIVVCCLFGAAFYSIGDDEAGYSTDMENIFIMDTGPGILGLPIEGMTQSDITSGFGSRNSPGGIGSTNHKGLDIGMPTGTIIRACESGTVTAAGWSGGHGKRVVIDHGDGLVTLYAHMSRIHATKGQKVQRGQVIGEVGSTGNSTGPHLHLEVIVNGKYMNPAKGFLSIPK